MTLQIDEVARGLQFLKWYNNPPSFYKDIFNEDPYPYQAEVLKMIKDNPKRIMLMAAGGSGKTKLLASITLLLGVVFPKFLKVPLSIIIISGSRDQARNLYEYVRLAFKDSMILSQEVEGEPLMSITRLQDRSLILAVPNSLKAIQGKHCFDDQTEILTSEGFKFFKDLNGSELIGTLNNKHYLEYQKINSLISYPFKGKLVQIKNKYVDIKCTQDHNLYIKTEWKEWNLHKAKLGKLPKRFRIKKDCKWIGNKIQFFKLPEVYIPYHKRRYPEKILPMKEWLKFLGYYLSEGSVEYSKGQNRISIANQDINKLEEISQLSSNLGFKPLKSIDRIRIHNRQLYEYLKQFGMAWDKFIPREIKSLSPDYLTYLLETLVKGDGHIAKSRRIDFNLSSKKLTEDIGEIGLKLGYTLTFKNHEEHQKYFPRNNKIYMIKPTYEVNLSRNNKEVRFSSKLSNTRERVSYNGMVYCVSVPNRIIMIRRNGKTSWVGNCDIVIIDEAVLAGDFIIRDAFRIVAQSKNDMIILSGTPMEDPSGKGELFVEMWEDEKKYPEWKRYHWSAKECPRISIEKYMEANKDLPEDMFSIFWEGKPYPKLGSLIPIEKLKESSRDVPHIEYDSSSGRVIAGIDWGWRDPTAIVILQYDKEDKNVKVLYVDKWSLEQFSDLHDRISKICKDYKVSIVYTDAEDVGENQRLETRGLNIEPIGFNQNKIIMQTRLKLMFHQKKIKIPEDSIELLTELRKYNWDTAKGEDLVDALMLALYKEEGEPSYFYKVA